MLKGGLLKASYILSLGGDVNASKFFWQHNIVSDIMLLVITSKNKFLEKSDWRVLFKLEHCNHPGTYCKDSSERLQNRSMIRPSVNTEWFKNSFFSSF